MTHDHGRHPAGFERRRLGVAVIGAGRMGTHRARLARAHPAVDVLAICDLDLARAQRLGERVGAAVVSADARTVIEDPVVNAVVVSTSEPEHLEPARAAIEAGKDVLVEKPIATSLEDADAIIDAAARSEVSVRVGYSQRFRRNVFLTRQHIADGRLGTVTGGVARVLNSRAQALAIMQRAPHVSPVVDALTYWVDVAGWFLGGAPPVRIHAAGTGTVLRDAVGPDGPDDLTTAVVRYADGAIVSFTICYSLPTSFPALGQSVRLEMVGTDGVVLLDDDHRQDVLFTDHGVDHAYIPQLRTNMSYLGSTTSGDWALGTMFGPIADETRSWLDHLATGADTQLCTPAEARRALAVTLAIEESVRTGESVTLPPA